jgi:hypothetical protein
MELPVWLNRRFSEYYEVRPFLVASGAPKKSWFLDQNLHTSLGRSRKLIANSKSNFNSL